MNKVLIGVSGGPDSMYLLNKLHSNGYEVIVAHVNYNLRPESNDEQQLVEDYCLSNNIKIKTLEVGQDEWEEVSFLKNKQSMAREIRFNFYQKLAEENNIENIYLAHHKDDFIETAIMLERRSDDYLYYGIKESSSYNGFKINRPLLDMYKKDIIKFNNDNNIPYMMDKTNEEPIYDRNIIRSELKDVSVEEKDIIYNNFLKINLEKEELRENTSNLYREWKEDNFSYDFYINIDEQFKKYVLYQFLINYETRVNINKDKIEGIIDFLKEKKGDKGFRLMENLFLGVKSNIIYVYSK